MRRRAGWTLFSRVAIARLVVIDVDAANRDGLADGLLRNSHWSWTSRVNALAYLRRNDEAIGELSSAIRGGWIPPFLPIHMDIALDPPLRELRSDPRFEPHSVVGVKGTVKF